MGLTYDQSKEWDNLLPRELNFYHLGKVISVSSVSFFSGQAVGFEIYSDVRIHLMVHFPFGEDASTYAEFGNILASRVATKLDKIKKDGLWISPPKFYPRFIKREVLGEVLFEKAWIHLNDKKKIPLQSIIFRSLFAEEGHA